MQPLMRKVEPENGRTQVWSCGGGTQSAAIAALIIQERLPRPDILVMVDTEREKTSTWEYANAVLFPELAKVGLVVEVIPKSRYATVDLWTGEDGDTIALPMFTDQAGEVSKLPGYCSGEWKREVVNRYLRKERKVEACDTWIGMSLDEMKRVRTSRNKWNQNRYPLIFDVPMRRHGCVHLVTVEMGWPKPPRSACYQCPNQSDDEWRELKETHPEDFERAVLLEREVRERDEHAFLHRSGVPLDQVDFTKPAEDLALFADLGCDSGFCFV